MDDAIYDIIVATAQIARETWEPIWPLWKAENGYPGPATPASLDACIPTAFALRIALNITAPELHWDVAGGRPTKRTPRGGFLDAAGVPWAHLWVEGRGESQSVIVDITADQFGAEPVIVARAQSASHTSNLSKGLRAYYEAHEATTIMRLHDALDAVMQRRAQLGTAA